MKKSFRGYDVKQVDELIGTLQSQNEALVAKIASLTMQLTAAESNNDSEVTIDNLNTQISEVNEKLETALKDKVDLEKRVRELTVTNQGLSHQIKETKNQQGWEQNASVKVGDICSRAYSDMEKVKRDALEEMAHQIDSYANAVNVSNEKMAEALQFVDTKYNTMLNSFAENLEDIFYKLKCIETGRKEIEKSLLPTQQIAQELKQQVNQAIEKSIANQKKEEKNTAVQSGLNKENRLSNEKESDPLDFLRQIRKSTVSEPAENTDLMHSDMKTSSSNTDESLPSVFHTSHDSLTPKDAASSSSKVIGLHTNITAEDILKSSI